MKPQIGSLAKVLFFAVSVLGLSVSAAAQQGPPDSEQPMEIPAQRYPQYPPPGANQYPPQYPQQNGPYPPPQMGAQYPQSPYPQQGGAPQQGGYPQGYPQQQGQYPQYPPQGPYLQQQGQTDPGAARLSFIHGDVTTQHSDSTDWVAATVNTPVLSGDHVSTGSGARAEIELDHANILRLSDQTTANIVNLSSNQMQLQIGQGLATYDVLKGSEADVQIQTPNVAIHPQAGEGSFRILVNSDGETIVDVRKGSADISTPQGSTRVDRNQRITIEGNADNGQYQVSNAPGNDDWDKWNSDRDRAITSAESWQHTNPYYTGSQDLDGYGQWNNVPDYGPVWFPAAGPEWAPYRDGRWVFESYYGWTWVSYEPWGWAPYHYGRWFVYGGNWGWWPGPVYAGYRPIWAPAYVSFLGFGGGGWGVSVGFGYGGGFGSIGWLPIGPGDRFYPWYGRGIGRVNAVNVYDIHNRGVGGFAPLREGPRAFSNVDRAFSDDRVRGGVSSMQANQFGRGRVPMQQARLDAGSFRQASVMTGANPVTPSRESFRPSDRQVSPSAIPNRAVTSQRFFGGSRQSGTNYSVGRSGGYPGATVQRGYNQPSSPSGGSSAGPGWRSFSGPSQAQPNVGGRTYGGRSGVEQQSYSQPSEPSRQYQPYSRGSSSPYGYSRPALNMQQPVVTPRERSYSAPAPSGRSAPSGGYRGGQPSGGSYGGGYSRGGSSGGSSHSSASGGHSSSGHDRH